MVTRYQNRLSGPLLDRIDIRVEVPRVEYEKLADNRLGESSSHIRERVERARQIQRQRFENYKPLTTLDLEKENPKAKALETSEADKQRSEASNQDDLKIAGLDDTDERKRLHIHNDITKAPGIERALHANPKRILTNGEMGPAEVRAFCQLDEAGTALLKAATRQLNLSARSYSRILKLGRTIADLAGSSRIQATHIAEAIQYRPKEQA
jgi:predicted ATPase with chaperone activity